jgi:hypothetical protein
MHNDHVKSAIFANYLLTGAIILLGKLLHTLAIFQDF